MPASLTMTNPTGPSVTASIRGNKRIIDNAGQSLSTGYKKNIDVVSQFLGKGLDDKARYLRAINESMGYSLNALKITQATLDSASNSLSEMLTLVAQSTGQSDESRATLNSILQDKKAQVSQQIKNAVFDGRKLLTGALGKNEQLTAKFNITSANAISADTKFNGANAAKAVKTLTVGAVPANDEAFYIEDVKFVAKPIGSVIDKSKNEFLKGTTTAETARNIATAINNSPDIKLQHYKVQQTGSTIVLTRNSSGAELSQTGNIIVVDSANITSANTTTGVTGAVDLTKINNMPELVGNVTASLELLFQVESNSAKGVALQYANPDAIADATAADANDSVAVMKLTLAGKTFIGSLYQSDANAANLNGRTAYFTNLESGEAISITGSAAWAGDTKTNGTATTAMTDIQTMLNNAVFYQTKTLDITTDYGAVYHEGIEVANTNSTKATFTNKNFTEKEFEDFKILTSPANAANTRFEAKISGETFRFDITTANIATTLFEGYRMDLVSTTDANNILSINIGENGLVNLGVATYEKVATAYKDMLTNAGAGLKVRIGENFEDVEKVKIQNLSDQQLYKQNNGVYLDTLSVLDDSGAELTDEALRNAINLVRSEQAKVSTKQETITAASNALLENIDVTQEGSDSYLKSDLVLESQAFSTAIKSINAAIAVLRSGAGIPDAAKEILNTI